MGLSSRSWLKRPRSECEEHLQEATEDWQDDGDRLRDQQQEQEEQEDGGQLVSGPTEGRRAQSNPVHLLNIFVCGYCSSCVIT